MMQRCGHVFGTDRTGAVSIMMAIMAPTLLAVAALVLDGGAWLVERTRLQIAADAAANGAGYLLLVSSLKSQSASAQAATFQSVAAAEAQAATGGKLIGTLGTPTVTVASDWRSVTVTLTSEADTYFAGAVGVAGPTLSASASTALAPVQSCVLALNSSAAEAIRVDNMGSIRASGCGIFSDSDASNAIWLDSGTISGQSVSAVGDFAESHSGSNTLSPLSPTDGASTATDPYAGLTPPAAGSCNYTNASFTAWQSQPYSFTQAKNVFCGNTTIGGNSTTDTFAPGVYYVVNGNLVFNNASITQASGVTFVLTGSSPGALSWTNYSNTATKMSAPTSGATAGILIWQECPSSGLAPANTMAGGSTLSISGAFYAPCGALDMSNNAQLATASGGSLTVVANTIYAAGSAGISATSGGGSGSSNSRPHLSQ